MDNSSHDVSERNLMAIRLNIHTKSHTVRGRPTLKLVERFGWVGPRILREINSRAILYEWTFYREISSKTCTCKHNRVFRRDREPSRILQCTLTSQKRERKLKKFLYERIRLTIPKSSWLRRYVKVRRGTKNVCKLRTKRVILNKVAQYAKKYLLNCSMRMYQRIIKLVKYRASRYLSVFFCNKPMCLCKRQSHVSNYWKFQLSSDIAKNPGHTLVYIDPSKTITAPYSQANELVFGQSSGQQSVTMSLTPLIYNKKQGINSANHLVSIMNIGNQLYSSLS